ncbi:MAG: GGDEF domain-containing phosphodiesterase [Clostridiales bacterium]|nr:GGDEF domain-containing phosphodiesterase [Clostridiales bacterium]
MEVMQKMFEYIRAREDILIMLWERESGWQTATAKSSVLKDADLSQIDLFQLTDWVHKDDLPAFKVFLEELKAAINGEPGNIAEDEEKVSAAVRLLSANDTYEYQNVNCWLEREEGTIARIFVMTDPLDREEIHLIHVAETFTSDRNPLLFQEQATKLIQDHPEKKFAIIQFDVPKFKMIHADYGEKKASELLNFFTSTLKVICNKYQLFSRLSADVFMVVTPYEDENSLYSFVELLDSHLLGYENLPYRLVYGICYVGDLTGGLRQYGDAAAMARQSIKSNALQKVAFYQTDLKKNISTSKFIEDNMNHALEHGEFVMYLQPKCNISDGRIVGAEALVRWIMPGHGIVPPNDFVPVFEKNGFVIKMDQYIWEEACKLIRKWIDAGITPLPISINVSRRHLKDTHFIQVLDSLIERYNIPKFCLEIEITETVDEAGITKSMKLLKEHGFTLLMDDFGSGYSSLNTLKDTQFDVIKIDRSFLQDFISSNRGQKIVEHTIQMAKSIGLDMIAEGVETKDQADFLQNCGCNTAQGFYYAKPMPVEQFETTYIR